MVHALQVLTLIKDHKWKGLLMWVKSQWNWVELVSHLMIVFLIPFVHLHGPAEDDVDLSILAAAVAIMAWWKLLYYMQAFESTGPLVVMIREILKDIIIFLLLAFGILFGFGTAFFVLFRHNRASDLERRVEAACALFDKEALSSLDPSDPEATRLLSEDSMDALRQCLNAGENLRNDGRGVGVIDAEERRDVDNAFGDLPRTLLTMFGFVLGDFELENLWEAESATIAIALFVLYMIAMMVVLLNLLIAIMGGKRNLACGWDC